MIETFSQISGYHNSVAENAAAEKDIKLAIECGRAAAQVFRNNFLARREHSTDIAKNAIMKYCPQSQLKVAVAAFNLELFCDQKAWASTGDNGQVLITIGQRHQL